MKPKIKQEKNPLAIDIRDVKVGEFANRKGNILYRFHKPTNKLWPDFIDGVVHVFKHPNQPVWNGIDAEVILVKNVDRKLINNTIKLLKDLSNDKTIDNLTYIENYQILKNYLEADIIKDGK